jgi:hypothetical protein
MNYEIFVVMNTVHDFRPNLVSHLSMKTAPNQTSALLCLPFRQELLDTVHQLHILARDRTLLIRETVPLDGVMDNSSHYLACQPLTEPNFDDNQPITLQLIRVMNYLYISSTDMLHALSLFKTGFYSPVQ